MKFEAFFNFSAFCSHYQLNSSKTYNTLQLLDRISILKLSQQFQKTTSLQFIISNKQLFYYLEENPKFDPVIKAILRTYGGIFESKMPINLVSICKKAGTIEPEAIGILKQLNKDKIVEFEHQLHDASITFLVPREDETSIYPFIDYIKSQAKNKVDKIEAMLAYVENEKICRSIQFLNYFGETEVTKCGICSVCKPPETNVKKEIIRRIYEELIEILRKEEQNSRQLVAALPFPENGILKVLQLMLERGVVSLTATNTYKLKN